MPTLRCLRLCRERAAEVGLSSEVIAVLDQCDLHTRTIVEAEVREDASVEILPVDFGDLGAARNAGFARARGDYGCTLDGDDLISSNWLVAAHQRAMDSGSLRVVHPEYVVEFGAGRGVTRLLDMETDDVPMAALLTCHPWTSSALAPIAAYRESPYSASTGGSSGYGFEDWHWNLEQVAGGRRHVTAKGTVLFYRKRPGSLLARQIADHRVVAPTRFFSADFFPRRIDGFAREDLGEASARTTAPGSGHGRRARGSRWCRLWSRLRDATSRSKRGAPNPDAPPWLPAWLPAAAAEMAAIESEIPQDAEALLGWRPWIAPLRTAPGEIYAQLLSRVAAQGMLAAIALDVEPARCGLIPGPGGAIVKLSFQERRGTGRSDGYVAAQEYRGTTRCGVDVIAGLDRLTDEEAQLVLVRLILQLRPRAVLAGEGLGGRVVETYAQALATAGVEVMRA